MSSILFDYHQGFGDHIICSGIVREYCRRYKYVGIFCLSRNYASVSFMYRDLMNLRVHQVESYAEKYRFRLLNSFRFGKNHYDKVCVIGAYDQESGILFERQIYGIAGVDIERKWGNFLVRRDAEKEQELVKITRLSPPYAFVHDDNRYPLGSARIASSLPLFRPDPKLTENMFDYCGIIERADEIHVIDSSFMFLIDCLPYSNPNQKLFVHRYARLNTPVQMPLLKKQWRILV
jgi:hypothetical protein